MMCEVGVLQTSFPCVAAAAGGEEGAPDEGWDGDRLRVRVRVRVRVGVRVRVRVRVMGASLGVGARGRYLAYISPIPPLYLPNGRLPWRRRSCARGLASAAAPAAGSPG